MSTPELQAADRIQGLVFARKVLAFANLGVFAGSDVLKRVSGQVPGLTDSSSDLSVSRAAISTLQRGILPSQAGCQAGVAEIDRVLVPLRAQRRDAARSVAVERPRPN